jgi:hypothetical protein
VTELSDRLRQECESRLEADYAALVQHLLSIQHFTRKVLAECLAKSLDQELRVIPQKTYEQKKDLARWLSCQLKAFNLAIRCPQTGLPAKLIANPGRNRSGGFFMLHVKHPDRGVIRPVSRKNLSDLLPFVLIDEAPRREALAEWRERTGTDTD